MRFRLLAAQMVLGMGCTLCAQTGALPPLVGPSFVGQNLTVHFVDGSASRRAASTEDARANRGIQDNIP